MDNSFEYKKIKEIDNFLFESYKKVNMYKYLTPINLLEENSKFLEKYKAGIEYNPIYEYKNNIKDSDSEFILNTILKYRRELEHIKFENNYNVLVKREIEMLEDLENMIYLSKNIGIVDSDIDLYSKKIYGEPDNELIKKAEIILKNESKENEVFKYNAKECKELFEEILKEFNLNWEIKINKIQSSKISVIAIT